MVFEIQADDEQVNHPMTQKAIPVIRRISIDKLQDEPKKLGIGF